MVQVVTTMTCEQASDVMKLKNGEAGVIIIIIRSIFALFLRDTNFDD